MKLPPRRLGVISFALVMLLDGTTHPGLSQVAPTQGPVLLNASADSQALTSVPATNPWRQVNATLPASYRLVGGGAEIVNSTDIRLVLQRNIFVDESQWMALGTSTTGYTGLAWVRAHVIGIRRDAPFVSVMPDSIGDSTEETLSDASFVPKALMITAPPGHLALCPGVMVTTDDIRLRIQSCTITGSQNSEAKARSITGILASWSVKGGMTHVSASHPFFSLSAEPIRIVTQLSVVDAESAPKSVSAVLPLGYRIVGGGARFHLGNDNIRLALQTLAPVTDVTGDYFIGAGRATAAISDPWGIEAAAVGIAETVLFGDSYEPNNSQPAAWNNGGRGWDGRPLSQIAGFGAQIDEDWYAIPAPGPDLPLTAQLLFQPADGNMDLALLDAAGNVLTNTAGTNGDKRISQILGPQGTYYLRVRCHGFLDQSLF